LRGASVNKKQEQLPDEPHDRARIVVVDPRRTVTVNACEVEAGKDNVLHLAINSGTDLVLFNALLTYVADKGWIDNDFIAASTNDFDKALAANKTRSRTRPRSPAWRPPISSRRPSGSPCRKTASAAAPCSPTRRA